MTSKPSTDPILIVVAHPDDETIGCGIQLSRWDSHRVTLVHVTDGSPRNLPDAANAGFGTPEDYAHERRRELYAALELVDVRPSQCLTFRYPDQEAFLHMAEIVGRLKALIKDLKPGLIYTHPYEGGHPDHDSVAFAVSQTGAPNVMEFTSYHRGQQGEPAFVTGAFLHGGETERLAPTPGEAAKKQKMLECFRTQQHVLRLFAVGEEKFRPAPKYDFSQPPHPGVLHYETLGWEMTGEQWRAKAAEELQLLQTRAAL